MYISFSAKINQEDHIVLCGFTQASIGCTNNKAGAQIRIRNSTKSAEENQVKNGVTEHGVVTIRSALARMTTFRGDQNSHLHEIIEPSQSLKIICQYNNLWNDEALFHFKIMNAFKDFHIINGPDVNEGGPPDGHFVPTKYFQSPVLEYSVERIEMSMAWWDQVRTKPYFFQEFINFVVN